ncbi:MAG: peptidoglycan DD-metalloendopeptidase family protein [Gammaproteobacteria bacterium]
MALTVWLSGCSGAVRWNETPSTSTRGTATTTATSAKPKPRRTVRRSGQHTVKAGESLYAIAHRYQLSARDIAVWNKLGSGELIFPGQVLRLTPPKNAATARPATTGSSASNRPKPTPAKPKTPAPSFVWPADGALAKTSNDIEGVGEGVDIRGKIGDPVRAAAAGRVVYSGDGLIGYGNLLIVKHSERFLTAYGYNKTLLVKEGDSVARGQNIASMGRGPDRSVRLHFEIRDNGKPVDPAAYLPTKRR